MECILPDVARFWAICLVCLLTICLKNVIIDKIVCARARERSGSLCHVHARQIFRSIKGKGKIMDLKQKIKSLPSKTKAWWHQPPAGRFLTLKEALCLGFSAMGQNAINCVVTTYVTVGMLPILYDMGDFSTLHATLICIIAYGIGLVVTPIYGRAMQRTKTKYGRYKPYIIFLAPVVSVLAVIASWSPQGFTTELQAQLYAYFTCIPLLVLWNLWSNAFNMFPGVFTPNQQERSDIWPIVGLAVGFVPTVMNVFKDVFAGLWGDVMAARIFGVTCVAIGLVLSLLLFKVKERVFVTEKEDEDNKISTWKGLKLVMKNKPLMILTLALCVGCFAGAMDMIWHIIARVKFAGTANEAIKIFGALSLIIGFAVTPNMILLPILTRKFSHRTIFMGWQAFNCLSLFILAIIGFDRIPTGSWSAIIITTLRFCAYFRAIHTLQPLMLSEIADYQQYKTGYRLEGFIQTFAYSVVMFVVNIAMLIPAVIQGKVGFIPNNYEILATGTTIYSPELVETALRYFNIAIWMSVASSFATLLVIAFYPLSKKKHEEIMRVLKERSVNAGEIESEEGKGFDGNDADMTDNNDADNADNAAVDNDDIGAETTVDTVSDLDAGSAEIDADSETVASDNILDQSDIAETETAEEVQADDESDAVEEVQADEDVKVEVSQDNAGDIKNSEDKN